MGAEGMGCALRGAHPSSSEVLFLGFSSSRRGPWCCQWAPRLCPGVLGEALTGPACTPVLLLSAGSQEPWQALGCLQVALRAGTGPGSRVSD